MQDCRESTKIWKLKLVCRAHKPGSLSGGYTGGAFWPVVPNCIDYPARDWNACSCARRRTRRLEGARATSLGTKIKSCIRLLEQMFRLDYSCWEYERDHLLLLARCSVSLIGMFHPGPAGRFTRPPSLILGTPWLSANHRLINEILGTMIRRYSGPLLIHFMRYDADKSHFNWSDEWFSFFGLILPNTWYICASS